MSKAFEERQISMRIAIERTAAINAARRTEKPAPVAARVVDHGYGDCHYCGCAATGFNFFDVPVCEDCR